MTRITKCLFALSLLATVAYPNERANATLQYLGQLPETGWHRIAFSSRTVGWIFSRSDLWKTVDGGRSWSPSTVPETKQRLPARIDDVQFSGPNGILLRGNRIFRTIDAGRMWAELPPIQLGEYGGELLGVRLMKDGQVFLAFGGIYRLAVADEDAPNNATQVDRGGRKLILEPGVWFNFNADREPWQRQRLPRSRDNPLGYRVTGMSVFDLRHIVASTESSVLYTGDGGKHWAASSFYGPRCTGAPGFGDGRTAIRLVYLVDEQNGWLSPDDGSLYRTTNGGRTWCQALVPRTIHSQLSPVTSYLESLAFSSQKLGWGVEVSGSLLETQDGGQNWEVAPNVRERLVQVFSLGTDQVWATSEDSIYRVVGPGN